MDFSGIIKITDLNDFLNPAENCSVHNNMIHKSSNNTAKVSLSDCLACSGCITSAETVLLSQQSVQTLESTLSQSTQVTISISQQSLISIANYFSLPVQTALSQIESSLKSKGIHRVLLMTDSRDSVLQSAYFEFLQNFRSQNFPVFASECPGWVCYGLKKGDERLIQYMSKCKTPMLVQREVNKIEGYHVAVMPCYDKKLEGVMETGVDLVITTTELMEFCPLTASAHQSDQVFWTPVLKKTSSLGYAEYVLKRSIKEIYNEEVEVEFRETRRRDVLEAEYKDLKFCIASGFQNIQNFLREIKAGKCRYHYIEIMACPMGCLNGSGQFRTSREDIMKIERETGVFYKENLAEPLAADRELRVISGSSLKW